MDAYQSLASKSIRSFSLGPIMLRTLYAKPNFLVRGLGWTDHRVVVLLQQNMEKICRYARLPKQRGAQAVFQLCVGPKPVKSLASSARHADAEYVFLANLESQASLKKPRRVQGDIL